MRESTLIVQAEAQLRHLPPVEASEFVLPLFLRTRRILMVMIRNCCTALVLARNKNAILFKFCCLSLTHTHVMSALGLNVACVKPDIPGLQPLCIYTDGERKVQ
jgi:hypothetical protein